MTAHCTLSRVTVTERPANSAQPDATCLLMVGHPNTKKHPFIPHFFCFVLFYCIAARQQRKPKICFQVMTISWSFQATKEATNSVTASDLSAFTRHH